MIESSFYFYNPNQLYHYKNSCNYFSQYQLHNTTLQTQQNQQIYLRCKYI